MPNNIEFDQAILDDNIHIIAGIDEAGRGPLFGPVVVASVIMPLDKPIIGIDDSKKLSAKKRDSLYDKIIETAIDWHIEFVDNNVIDDINILEATKLGMINCINAIKVKPDIVLIDAVKIDSDCNTMSIIKGDAKSYNIASASILAKVARDRYILSIAQDYEQYDIANNKGYPTKKHTSAVKQFGATSLHRQSFLKNIDKW